MKAYTLAQVREIMAAKGIKPNHDIEVARKRANPNDRFLANMCLALSLHSWSNTAEEWQRLEAALMLLAAKRRASRERK